MTGLALALLVGLLAFAFLSTRHGLIAVVLIGFAQDIARKLVAGEPVWLQGFVWIALVFALVRQASNGAPLLRWVRALFPKSIQGLARFFFLLVVLQALVAFVRTNSVVVPTIGTLAYTGPILAVAAAAAFLRSQAKVEELFGVYVVAALVNAIAVIASFRGLESQLLSTVGGDMLVYQEGHAPLRLIAGLLRSGEVSSWHCATAVMICVTFARSLSGRRRSLKMFLFAATVPLTVALILTGRRKMVAALVLAAIVQVLTETTRRRGGWRVALGAAAGLFVVLLSVRLGFTEDVPPGMEGYVERSRTIRADWIERLQLTVDSLSWTAAASGYLGLGTGMTSQGSQHYVEVDDLITGASETGPSKVMTELGVPGLLLLIAIAVRLFRSLWRQIGDKAVLARAAPVWEAGLFSYLIANVGVFAIAHQVFGDPFVLLMLGLMLGTLLVLLRRPFAEAASSMVAVRSPDGVAA